MKLPFPRTTRWMDDERPPVPLPIVVLLGVVMTCGLMWFFEGRLKVYGISQSARIEVDSVAHQVQPPVAGVVSENHLSLGLRVVKEDVLLVLDSTAERLQLAQDEAKLQGLRGQLEMLQNAASAERDARSAQERAVGAAAQVAQARGQVARMTSEQASREDVMVQQLHTNSLATGLEALKSASEARRQQGEAMAARLEAMRIAASGQTELKDRSVRLARLDHEISSLEAEIRTTVASNARLQFEIERRTVRASVSGVVADLTPMPVGSTVSPGQKLAVIVPEGENRVVARFLPSEAVGRLQPQQSAVVRLDAFPWTEYGVLECLVTQVAREPQEGMIRVEMVAQDRSGRMSLSHGLTGTAEVSIEDVAPYRLLMRAAGQLMVAPPKNPTPAQPSPPSARLP